MTVHATLLGRHAAVTDPGAGDGWPDRLLPIAELNGAWVCVDCRSGDGVLVVGSGDDEDPFMTNDRGLDWLFGALVGRVLEGAPNPGADLSSRLFEPDRVTSARNPFTKRTELRTERGRPRGRPWP